MLNWCVISRRYHIDKIHENKIHISQFQLRKFTFDNVSKTAYFVIYAKKIVPRFFLSGFIEV